MTIERIAYVQIDESVIGARLVSRDGDRAEKIAGRITAVAPIYPYRYDDDGYVIHEETGKTNTRGMPIMEPAYDIDAGQAGVALRISDMHEVGIGPDGWIEVER